MSLGGDETVLVAEDDVAVGLLTRIALEHFGYTVLSTNCGEEALQVAAGHSGPIHILLTDMLMAGMSGLDLATRVRALLPEIKVLFMSGFSENAMTWSGSSRVRLCLSKNHSPPARWRASCGRF